MTQFHIPEEFKRHLADEGIDFMLNHSNETVALAMEAVIQVGIRQEDGAEKLSPRMHRYLENAVGILQEYDSKKPQIDTLIKNGKYYLDNMAVVGQNNTPEHQNTN